MSGEASFFDTLDFVELEHRFGLDNARAILRTLEQFEGIAATVAADQSYSDRMQNVLSAMKDNLRFQTRH